jgi:hypothetical protein
LILKAFCLDSLSYLEYDKDRHGRRCLSLTLKKEGKMETVERHSVWNIVTAPFIGLAYVIALPFVAIGTVSVLLAKRVVDKLATFASFGWRPMEAYLTGRKNRRAK